MLPKTWKDIVKCVRTHKLWRPRSLHAAVRILDDPTSPQQLRTYLIDDPFLNQKTLKYKHSKNKFIYEKLEV